MLLLLLAQLGGEPLRLALRFDRAAMAAGEWWRLLSGNFVHLGTYHWALNELGLLALILLCPQPLAPWRFARRVLVLSLAVGLGLYWALPSLDTYVGMSGVIHGLFVLALLPQVMSKDAVGLVAMLYLLAKLAYEFVAGAAVSDEAAIGGHVVTQAHAIGALAAFVYAVVLRKSREEFPKLKS